MEILNQYTVEIVDHYVWGISPWIILSFILIGGGIVIFWNVIDSWSISFFSFMDIFIIISGCCLICLGILCWHVKPVYREIQEYQITVNDTTTFNEITNNYEIMEQNGEIFTVREKGWESTD
jgi:hypothetical protein